jgi:enamine deaminase RidA (YjgF/YER057c/UK114 family)
MSASARLAELGLTLPAAPRPVAAYVPAVRHGNLVYTSGQLPSRDGELIAVGKVGAEVDPETAAECARVAILNAVAVLAEAVGGIDEIERIVKVTVFVASAPDFTGQPQVANGASELLVDVFGESGRHARSAVGLSVLPLDAPVEIEVVAAVAGRPSIQPA